MRPNAQPNRARQASASSLPEPAPAAPFVMTEIIPQAATTYITYAYNTRIDGDEAR
ncbi:hypothetical protein GGE06_003419 [Streptomyces sp. SFB5A]|uniref:Uncharacterized protein n=1 Tax=Streptomyces nymphaeiformis TaxID=2663842 RepID=A0A7W7TZZ7_9ACTN|nr:hypothetical protein [Streptomyces nymphaeiformis]